MRENTLQRTIRFLGGLLWVLTGLFAVLRLSQAVTPASADLAGRVALLLAVAGCRRLQRRGTHPFFAGVLLPMLALWPDAWSLAAGLLALAVPPAGRRGAALRRARLETVAASLAWCVAYGAAQAFAGATVDQALPAAMLRCGVAWIAFEGLRHLLAVPFAAVGMVRRSSPTRSEWTNLPLAVVWTAVPLAAGSSLPLLLAPAVAAAQLLVVRLDETRSSLRAQRAELEQRTAEVLTLHALGREMLARSDPDRLGPLLDRECRKMFEPDALSFGLLHEGGVRLVYRREGERVSTARVPLDERFAGWLQREKRGTCWRAGEGAAPLEPRLGATRSALIAPLLVEGEVVGVLSIESRRAEAFSEHQLAVLTTIAQQAAAAWEASRHQRRATTDSLTGFFLRDYFFRRVEEESRRSRRYGASFALLMIDLDGFKDVNDRYGHLAGDHYLRGIAETIRGRLRAADLPCRYGGDEFSVLLPETDRAGALVIAERIREAVARLAVDADGPTLRGTVSIGLAAFPEVPGESITDLLRHADEALYRAKRGGRDRVVAYAA